MPVGFQAFGPGGHLFTDMTSSISQMQGSFDTGGADGGAAMEPLPPGKTRFYIIVYLVDSNQWRGKKPGVTISGNSIQWRYSFQRTFGQFAANCRIFYGFY